MMSELKSGRDDVEVDYYYPVLEKDLRIQVRVRGKELWAVDNPSLKLPELDSEICFLACSPSFTSYRKPNIIERLFGINIVQVTQKRWNKALSYCRRANDKRRSLAKDAELISGKIH